MCGFLGVFLGRCTPQKNPPFFGYVPGCLNSGSGCMYVTKTQICATQNTRKAILRRFVLRR